VTDRAKDTIEAKFKNVPFFVRTETQAGGRKVAVSEYPGSDNRFVEDMGKKPGIYTVKGFVSGEDWRQRSRRLTTVLEESTEGDLELSTFGIIRVKAQTFTKTVNQTELGFVYFDITFLVTTPNPSPVIASSNQETVAKTAVDVLEVVQTNFSENFTVPNLATTAEVAEYDGVQLTNTVVDEISALGQEVDQITSAANNVRDNISELVRDPIAYASAMFNDGFLGDVFDTIEVSRDALNALSKLSRAGYNLAVDFESIGDDALSNASQSFDIPEFADDTSYRQISNSNRNVVVNSLRTSIFATYLNQAARNEYATDSDINATIADIDDVYENVILIATTDPIVAQTLDQSRIEALKVLDDKIQTTPKVEELKLKVPTNDIELAYRLYAEDFVDVDDLTEKADVLTDLNDILPTRYKETVEVLKI